MKRVFVHEEWCLGCHLCEYNCAFANSGVSDMVKALKNKSITPRIHVEEGGKIHYAVSCRHCEDPLCIKGCISGALTKGADGVVTINRDKCVGCLSCMLLCPYGSITTDEDSTVLKCELCVKNSCGAPACVQGCPNRAIVFEEAE